MHYTCIIAFTGSQVGWIQQSSPAIQSTDPVHNPVQRLEMAHDLSCLDNYSGCLGIIQAKSGLLLSMNTQPTSQSLEEAEINLYHEASKFLVLSSIKTIGYSHSPISAYAKLPHFTILHNHLHFLSCWCWLQSLEQ